MIIVSHRGNLSGRIPERENSPSYIEEAISAGYDVEIDVWFVDGQFYLGHDLPQYPVSSEWLCSNPLWCHAKNKDALDKMMGLEVNCFWHETDKFTVTSDGFLWCFPGNFSGNGVTVDLSEEVKIPNHPCLGICTDVPVKWSFICNQKEKSFLTRL